MSFLTKQWPAPSPTNFDYAEETQDVIDEIDAGLADHEGRIGSTESAITTLTSAKQNVDSDLTAIAALTPADNDVIQRKSGGWTNRTPTQLKSDLALVKADVGLGSVTNDVQLKASQLNTDSTMAANSDANVPSQKAVKTRLDVLDAAKQPTGGVWGQVLSKQSAINYDDVWADVPGIVYPSLLLSPDGSANRSGALSATVPGAYSAGVVDGRNAWTGTFDGTNPITVPLAAGDAPDMSRLAMISRVRISAATATGLYLASVGDGMRIRGGAAIGARVGNPAVDINSNSTMLVDSTWHVYAVTCRNSQIFIMLDGVHLASGVYTGDTTPYSVLRAVSQSSVGNITLSVAETVLYPDYVPLSELARISRINAPWTMSNIAANIYQPASPMQLFTPTNKIATGGATARNAPGTSADTIATLAQGTLVADTGQRQNVSSVDYALLFTKTCAFVWVPLSTLTTL